MIVKIEESYADEKNIRHGYRIISVSRVFVVSSDSSVSLHIYDSISRYSFTYYMKKKLRKPFTRLSLQRFMSDSHFSVLRMDTRDSVEEYTKFIKERLLCLNKPVYKPLKLLQIIDYDN